MEKDIFEEYIKHTEPEKKEKAYAWSPIPILQA